MEGMAGFGTAIAIPASMLVAMGFNPVKAILLCLIANSVPTTYGSIGIPASTLANLTGLDPVQLSTYISLQLLPLNIICPFLMVIVVGGSIKALRGVFLLTLLCGLGLALPELLISAIAGPELAVMISSVVIMGIIVLYSKYRPSQDETYHMDIHPAHVPLHGGFLACLPFILIFVFLLLTSKFVPAINVPLSAVKTSVVIYTGPGASPYTFVWLATPGVLIFLAAFISGYIQKASFSEMFFVLLQTIRGLRNTIITIIAVIATAKVMGYSGMTSDIASTAVDVTGNFLSLYRSDHRFYRHLYHRLRHVEQRPVRQFADRRGQSYRRQRGLAGSGKFFRYMRRQDDLAAKHRHRCRRYFPGRKGQRNPQSYYQSIRSVRHYFRLYRIFRTTLY